MPTKPQKHPQTSPPRSAPATRPAPIREQLQTAVNRTTVNLAEKAFSDIDRAAQFGKIELKKRGVEGFEEIMDSGADLLKRLLARGLSK